MIRPSFSRLPRTRPAALALSLAAAALAVVTAGTVSTAAVAAESFAAPAASAASAVHPAIPHATAPAPASDANLAAIRHGEYIARAADCVACHTDPEHNRPFAGGYPLQTPFGKLLASNITSDPKTGIGGWTEAEFTRAVREGRGRHGEYLYPAMPYTDYVKISDADMHDLWAYIRTVPPVDHAVESNQLPFPFNIRLLMFGWNLLFFDRTPFTAPAGASAQLARGAYLVQGAGHCEACHTLRNAFGGPKGGAFLNGGDLAGWHAPDLTSNRYTGIGAWSDQDIADYLKTGGNHAAIASGPMAEAVTNSTQYLTDGDLKSIAVYLKSLPASPNVRPQPLPRTDPAMMLGQRVYMSNCIACHASSGAGIPGIATRFPAHPGIQAPSARSVVTTVLMGGRGAVTQSNPTGGAMPSFAWKLSDAQVAAVSTYVRNTWGNAAPAVSADDVKDARKSLGARQQLRVSAAH
ncbi:c-type cytochrome [Burkholderia sp. Ac-20379]|uniref:c-type cytochrome n=1 Tax=Burkholderia sp. Ac-20379 TaxID=2703900 RepID=UPI00197E0144|nr:cytochrome c [Burkholderia sp. Ac-20379]MBN3722672.1 cytochrome c [Burkholderia sp. Ac-20379]